MTDSWRRVAGISRFGWWESRLPRVASAAIQRLYGRYLARGREGIPPGALSPLSAAEYVVLRFSSTHLGVDLESCFAERAMVLELLAAGKKVAVSADPAEIFGKRVYWHPPHGLIFPRLWDYSRQCFEFAAGLEAQGNSLFVSSEEIRFWENKAYMHERFANAGIPTPLTTLVNSSNWDSCPLPPPPLLFKEEHSAGSTGIHFLASHGEARAFAAAYRWAPGGSLIAQHVVDGSTRDLRVTMVGSMLIADASFWRIKAPAAPGAAWTTTASKYNSSILHGDLPAGIREIAAAHMDRLGLRTAGLDFMFEGDDVRTRPLLLELSPVYQPNPVKPQRYAGLTYKQYKRRRLGKDLYLAAQFDVYRLISREVVRQGLW